MSQINEVMFHNINLDISENKTRSSEWLQVFPRALLLDLNSDLAPLQRKVIQFLSTWVIPFLSWGHWKLTWYVCLKTKSSNASKL